MGTPHAGPLPRPARRFAEFSPVHLRRAVTYGDTIHPEGTEGIVVDVGTSGWYEVEFFEPKPAVITLSQDDLR